MEKGTINLKLPLIKVNVGDPWRATDFVNEHFPAGCFIVDDGIQYYFVSHDGSGYIYDMCIARDVVQEAIVEDARYDEFKESLSILANINNRLEQITRVTGECKDEVAKSETRITDELLAQSEVIRDGLEKLGSKSSGDGVNILDVAKSFAVIQKPELIEKL